MSVYLIAQINITNRSEYSKYEAGFTEIFSKYSGTMLSVDESPALLEGNWKCTRTVLIEFPTRQEAMAWYNSSEYKELAIHRFNSSTGNVVIMDGLNDNDT